MALTSGTRLGAFEIVSFLGAGGVGEVYRARDTRLDRTVAIKMLRAADLGRADRFRREARAVSRLNHPHICSLYDVAEFDGAPYLVMEYVDGRTLADRLEDGPLPVQEALTHGIEICEALDRAHAQGVVHRDVKPSNVMLTRGGVKLLDFGVAKLTAPDDDPSALGSTETLELTREGQIVGTIAYMSPEQLEGHDVDPRTDLFACGAVLFEMITGRPAFAGKSRASVTAAILTSEPPPMAALQPVVPSALDHVVAKALAKDPDARWQTARDLGSELRWILQDVAAGRTSGRVHRPRGGSGLLPGALIGTGIGSTVALAAWLMVPDEPIPPSFERITYRRGAVSAARFAPDGRTIVYSAAWEGHPYELFLAQLGSLETRALGMKNSRILSVSRNGEMAVLLGMQNMLWGQGTVARASLAGGAPRELVEGAVDADWTPDGALAVVKRRENGTELEFPAGTKAYEAGAIWWMRVSPKGDRVAFFVAPTPWPEVRGDLVVVDRSLKRTTLAKGYTALGLAWAPAGDEVWFTGVQGRGAPAVHAASLAGRTRVIARVPAWLMLQDISRDGRVLLTKGLHLLGMQCQMPGETRERELGWLDQSRVEGLSADGTTVLFGESGEGSWVPGSYTRKSDGSPAVRLGDGHPESLSPDGRWVLARAPGIPWGREWVLLPAGPGFPRVLPRGAIAQLREGAWLPDGQRIVFTALEEGRLARAYVQDVETGSMRAITPEGVHMPEKAASPDGRSVLVSINGDWWLYPIDEGKPRRLPFLDSRDDPRQWSTDGRILYVARGGNVPPMQLHRLDVTTGRRVLWKSLVPADPVGIERLESLVMTPDGRGYCYSYARRLSELYVAEGLK